MLVRSKLYILINVFLFNLVLLRPCLLKTPVSTSYAYILMIDYLLCRLVDSQYDSQILGMILIKYMLLRSGQEIWLYRLADKRHMGFSHVDRNRLAEKKKKPRSQVLSLARLDLSSLRRDG